MSENIFFQDLSAQWMQAACNAAEIEQLAMALVSTDLIVLRQTVQCERILESGSFYSIEGLLPKELTQQIRACIREQYACDMTIKLLQQVWNVYMQPVSGQEQCILVFREAGLHQVGISIAAAKMRRNAAQLVQYGQAVSAEARRRAAQRMLRQITHIERLTGAPQPIEQRVCSINRIITKIVKQLTHYHISCEGHVLIDDAKETKIFVDEYALRGAILNCVSNSLIHGQAEHIILSAHKQDSGVLIQITDDGLGMSEEALQQLDHTWQKPDALPGQWGLGIPYARHIVVENDGKMLIQTGLNGCTVGMRFPFATSDQLEAMPFDSFFLDPTLASAQLELSDFLENKDFKKQEVVE